MPASKNQLIRIRTIDECLHNRQKLWTLQELTEKVANVLIYYNGHDSVSERTIQRDIELMRYWKLGYCAPIVVREKKYYTYEDPNFSITQMPITENDIKELSSAMDILKHYQSFQYMAGMDDIITKIEDKINSQISKNKIVYIETNQQLKGLNFLNELYQHISQKNVLSIKYHSFRTTKELTHIVSPYILKEFNNRWFVYVYHHNSHNIMNLALDRIVSISINEKVKFVENKFFEAEEYFSGMVGVTRPIGQKLINVVLKVSADQAPYVLTKPLHCSQEVLETKEDGSIVVKLHLIHNLELERLIFGYAEAIEVLYPRNLRKRIAHKIIMAAEVYNKG